VRSRPLGASSPAPSPGCHCALPLPPLRARFASPTKRESTMIFSKTLVLNEVRKPSREASLRVSPSS